MQTWWRLIAGADMSVSSQATIEQMEMANSMSPFTGLNSARHAKALYWIGPIWMQALRQQGKSEIVQGSDGSLCPSRGKASNWLKRRLYARKSMLRSRDEGPHRLAYLPSVRQVWWQVRTTCYARKPPQCALAHRWSSFWASVLPYREIVLALAKI